MCEENYLEKIVKFEKRELFVRKWRNFELIIKGEKYWIEI